MHRFLRCMICLVVICAMVVQVSPIQAHAISTGVLAAAAISVTIGTLIGLGISTGADTIAHTELAQEAVEVMKQAGYVTAAGTMALTSLGSGRYGVRSSLVESLFSWIYDSGTVQSGFKTGAGYINYSIGNISVDYDSDIQEVAGIFVTVPDWAEINSETWYTVQVAVRNSQQQPSFVVSGDVKVDSYYSNIYSVNVGDDQYRFAGRGVQGYVGPYHAISYNSEKMESYMASLLSGGGSITTSKDLTLNFVASPGISLAEGYPEWAANSVVIDGETYYPVAVAPTFEETQTFTQADVWAGNGTLTDTNTGTGSGTVTVPDNATLKDILTGVLTIPQAISIAASNVVAAVQAIPAAIQAIPAAIADFFSVKGEVGSFTISLSDYFPFCIPFDLYDFFACLNADPVAPVIEWAIFERDGTAHPITIDLSPYDSVAQLLRRLQLLLFCVGLAFKTRDLIKG